MDATSSDIAEAVDHTWRGPVRVDYDGVELLPAGRATLLLGPPGADISAMLRILSDQRKLHLSHASHSFKFNGESHAQHGIVHYASTADAEGGGLAPALTVRETLAFAASCACMPLGRALEIAALLELESCLDVFIGSDVIRGVSGGQRRRACLGEALVTLDTRHRVLLLDEPTTGLDAALALRILTRILEWGRQGSGGIRLTIGAALLQPSPELLALFDWVVCLSVDGGIAYAGTPDGLQRAFESAASTVLPPGLEVAEWVVSLLHAGVGGALQVPRTSSVEESRPPSPHAASWHRASVAGAGARLKQLRSLAVREFRLAARDAPYAALRCAHALFFGLVLGSLFVAPPPIQGNLKLSVATFAAFLLATAAMPGVAAATAAKAYVRRHVAVGLYGGSAYVVAAAVAALPLLTVEAALLTGPLYAWVRYDPAPERYAFFLLLYVLLAALLNALFRYLGFAIRGAAAAQATAAPITGFLLLLTGFLVTSDHIGPWLIWAFWVSPFAWLLRSVVHNEMLDPSPALGSLYTASGPIPGTLPPTWGEEWATIFGIATDRRYMWGGVGFLAVTTFVLHTLTAIAVGRLRHREISAGRRKSAGTSTHAITASGTRSATHVDATETITEVARSLDHDVAVSVGSSRAPTPRGKVALPKHRVTLCLLDVSYTLPSRSRVAVVADALLSNAARALWLPVSIILPRANDNDAAATPSSMISPAGMPLLSGVNLVVRPGECVCVLGASGAGKTTLLDVIAGIKTVGRIGGSIKTVTFTADEQVTGRNSQSNLQRSTVAFAQQSDLHMSKCTVREALQFSAALRNDVTSLPHEARAQLVADILVALELEHVADALIGDTGSEVGRFGDAHITSSATWSMGVHCCGIFSRTTSLTSAERRMVTVGVELAARPSVLLLDEPTSGLDAAAAAAVMRTVSAAAAASGVAVCATIHQPSGEVVRAFDRGLVLVSGKTVYAGRLDPASVSSYFSRVAPAVVEARPLVPGANPATWVLQLVSNDGMRAPQSSFRQVDFVALWHDSPEAAALRADVEAAAAIEKTNRDDAETASPAVVRSRPCHFWTQRVSVSPLASLRTQVALLLRRAWLAQLRDTPTLVARFAALAFLGLLVGALYTNLSLQYAGGVQSALALWFISLAMPAMVSFAVALPGVVAMRAIVHRERTSRMYHVELGTLADIAASTPLVIGSVFIFAVIFYFTVGGRVDAASFFHFAVTLSTLSLAYSALGIAMACVLPTAPIALLGGLFLQSLLLLFGGLFITGPNIPTSWRFAYYLNPLRYAAEAVWAQQYFCSIANLNSGTCPEFAYAPNVAITGVPIWSFVEAQTGITGRTTWSYIGIVIAFCFFYVLLAVVSRRWLSFIRR